MLSTIFLPLYLNEGLVNALKTEIELNSTVKIQKISTRNQETVSFNTPISEIGTNLCGRFIQGDVNVQVLSEQTLERETIKIHAFIEIQTWLGEKNILKTIKNAMDLKKIKEMDYVEISCMLSHNPEIQYMEELVDLLELQVMCGPLMNSQIDEKELRLKKESIEALKKKIEKYKELKCYNFVSEKLFGSDIRAVIPVENKHMLDHIEHIADSRVTIMGKVIKIDKNINLEAKAMNGTGFKLMEGEYLYQTLQNLISKFNIEMPVQNKCLADNFPSVTILPLAIYL